MGSEEDPQPSSIDSLPDEVILNIFHHVRKHHDWTRVAMLHATVTVSQVCSRWRAIALEASVLWSELVFRASDMRNLGIAERAGDRMDTCLLRSRSHPLNIYFDLLNPGCAIFPLEIFNAFVLPSLWRCRILEVVISDWNIASAIFPLRCNLSCMQSLGVAIQLGFDDEDEFPPALEIGGLRGVPFYPSRLRVDSMLPINFPYIDSSRLQDLFITNEMIGYTSLTKAVTAARDIERLHLSVMAPASLFPEELVLPKLSFFSTTFGWPSSNLRAPALRKLCINEPTVFHRNKEWIRLSPNVRHLTLAAVTLSAVIESFDVRSVEMIYSVLDELPQLVTLELKHWLVNWLLHFAISSPIAPLAIDTEWLSSHDPLISPHIPPPGADDPDRREAKLDVPTPQSNTFLPNLRLLIISPDDPTESIFFSQYDLGLALRRILHARPNLSLHYDGFFMAGGTANFEKGQALLSESMDLGHIRFGGRVDALYSGVQNDIVV